MTGDEGREVSYQQVPTIGGLMEVPSTAKVVTSEHLGNECRAEGVMYPEAFGSGPDATGYPSGTAMTDSTPGDNVN